MNSLKNRVHEIFKNLMTLNEDIQNSNKEINERLRKVKEVDNEEEKLSFIKECKFYEIMNNFRYSEIDNLLRTLLELRNISILEGIDLELTEEQNEVVSESVHRFSPMFVYSGNKAKFNNEELLEVIKNKLDNPSENEMEVFASLVKAIENRNNG